MPRCKAPKILRSETYVGCTPQQRRMRGTKIRAKKPKIKAEGWVKRYQDLLEIARLVSWCMSRDYLIKTCLDHLSQRLGKRA